MNRIKKLASVVLSAVVCGASQVFAAAAFLSYGEVQGVGGFFIIVR